jgi:hypothetical protein
LFLGFVLRAAIDQLQQTASGERRNAKHREALLP